MSRNGIEAMIVEGVCSLLFLGLAIWSGEAAYYAVVVLGVCCMSFIGGYELSRSLWRPLTLELLDDLRATRNQTMTRSVDLAPTERG